MINPDIWNGINPISVFLCNLSAGLILFGFFAMCFEGSFGDGSCRVSLKLIYCGLAAAGLGAFVHLTLVIFGY